MMAFSLFKKWGAGHLVIPAMMGIATVLLLSAGCKNSGSFKETASGLKYKIINDAPGNPGKTGDYLKIEIRTVVHDTSIMDTRKEGEGFRWLSLQKSNGQPFDMMEGLALLSKGDSAEFTIPADSVPGMQGTNRPPFVEKGDLIHIYVKVLDVRNEQEYQSDLANEKKAQETKDDAIIKSYMDSLHLQGTRTENGVYVVQTKPGTGDTPKDGQEVSVMYTGKTLDGTPFDSNQDTSFHHSEPLTFVLGRQAMIPGMEEGVKVLGKGAEATLIVPSGLAYGPMGREPAIKPNEVLMFDIRLNSISGTPAPPPPPIPQGK